MPTKQGTVYTGPGSLPNATLFQQLALLAAEVSFVHKLGQCLVSASEVGPVCRAIAESIAEGTNLPAVALCACSGDRLLVRALARDGEVETWPKDGPIALLPPDCREQLRGQRELKMELAQRRHSQELCETVRVPRLHAIALGSQETVEGLLAIAVEDSWLAAKQLRSLLLVSPLLTVALRGMSGWRESSSRGQVERPRDTRLTEGSPARGMTIACLGAGANCRRAEEEAQAGGGTESERIRWWQYGASERSAPELVWGVLTGLSRGIASVIQAIRQTAKREVPVLVHGPIGAEKVFVAKAVHCASLRSMGLFLVFDCGASHSLGGLGEGVREVAKRGSKATLLIRGVELLSDGDRIELRQLIEEGLISVSRQERGEVTGFRLMATAGSDLPAVERALGTDLFQLIGFSLLEVPGLEQRACDIPFLASQLLALLRPGTGLTFKYLAPEAMTYLMFRRWPGNTYQLAAVLQRAAEASGSPEIGLDALLKAAGEDPGGGVDNHARGQRLRELMEQLDKSVEAQLIVGALARTGDNRTQAARLLGIGRRTLLYKIKEFSSFPEPPPSP